MRPTPRMDRRVRIRRNDFVRVATVILILLLLHFYLIPSLVDSRYTPDLLLVGLLLLVIRQPPGFAALTGLLFGLIFDTLTPSYFGSGILVHILVAIGATWWRGVVFADNLLVTGGLFFAGVWVRDVLLLALNGTSISGLVGEMFLVAPLHALSTAVVGIVIVLLFQDWLAIRIER